MTKKKRSSAANKWDDHYTRKARKEKFSARSVYKLKEIQEKYRLIQPGQRILDLGCAPGSWLQYAASLVRENGQVVGIDQKPVTIRLPSRVTVYEGDIFSIQDVIGPDLLPPFDVVVSDMAPATTGNKNVDTARSMGLCEAALHVAQQHLKPGGSFICKVFQGGDYKQFTDAVRSAFHRQKAFKPQSCRKASKEIYVIGIDKKQEEICPDTASGQP